MIILTQYWLERESTACFLFGAKKFILFVPTAKRKCSGTAFVPEYRFCPAERKSFFGYVGCGVPIADISIMNCLIFWFPTNILWPLVSKEPLKNRIMAFAVKTVPFGVGADGSNAYWQGWKFLRSIFIKDGCPAWYSSYG